MSDGYFPGVEELSPELQDAVVRIGQDLGISIRRRCAMPEFARADFCKWRHRPVTASIRGSVPGLSESQVQSVFRRALDIWNSAANIGFVWTDNFGSANVWAECKRIDGASGTLAWSFLPPCGSSSTVSTQLEQRYDTSERWSEKWFLETALHELGHAIGFGHASDKTALMAPYSSGGFILAPTAWEIERVVPAYGPPVGIGPDFGPANGVLISREGTSHPVTNGTLQYSGKTWKVTVTQ